MKATQLDEKRAALLAIIKDMGTVAVAFSGGVDSTFLLAVAHETLGDGAVAITVAGHATSPRDLDRARSFCHKRGIRHVVIPFDELSVRQFRENLPDRCYHCKRSIFTHIAQAAADAGAAYVVDGSNVDDESDYRPGMKALLELGVRSPLREAAMTKADVRELSRTMDLPTWNLPSAACLASRFAYGDTLTIEKLERVGKAEEALSKRGFAQVRVRVHGANGELARIEVESDEIARLASDEVRTDIVSALTSLGFTYVSLDLRGFRSGAMNEVLGR